MIDWQSVISPLPGRVAVLVLEDGLGFSETVWETEADAFAATGPSLHHRGEALRVDESTLLPFPAAQTSAGRGGVAIPEAVRRRAVEMGRPPYELVRGVVVAAGRRRGRVPMPPVGAAVWALPKPGLIVESGDIDLPALGRLVPRGWTLRIYGVGERWDEQVLGYVG